MLQGYAAVGIKEPGLRQFATVIFSGIMLKLKLRTITMNYEFKLNDLKLS